MYLKPLPSPTLIVAAACPAHTTPHLNPLQLKLINTRIWLTKPTKREKRSKLLHLPQLRNPTINLQQETKTKGYVSSLNYT